MSDAVTVIEGRGPIVLTCEHASLAVPAPWAWPEADRWLEGTHWSYDLGVADLARDLHAATGWPAVLAGFTRLLVDPNRAEDHADLFRTHAEGRPIHLNAGLSKAEQMRRIQALYRPYHQAVDRVVRGAEGAAVVSLHSFSPVYEGHRREMELGVLFNDDEDLGLALSRALSDAGWAVRPNEPWSGKAGLMHAAEAPARAHGRVALEIEVRHELLLDEERRSALCADLVDSLDRLLG